MIKPTPGPMTVRNNGKYGYAIDALLGDPDLGYSKWTAFAEFWGSDDLQDIGEEKAKVNAELAADAFNTYHATGLMPSELAAKLSEHKSARIAYANEFPLDGEGEPDVGNIHANIRALKAQRDRLLEALQTVRDYIVTMKGIGHEYQMIIDSAITNAKGKTE